MRANLRHISCDAITHTQSELSANVVAAVLRRAMNGDDEWQQSTNANAAGDARCAGNQSGHKPTFVLLDVVRFTPEYSLSGSFEYSLSAISDVRSQNVIRQCNARMIFLRRSSVIFVETLCAVTNRRRRHPAAQPANAPTSVCVIRFECQ
jgi:hypothetical protein